jgi:primosomal protein N' (replication factor Y)
MPESLVCHYCQYQEPVPSRCPRCSEDAIRRRGVGTQQVERVVAERFPEARIARMDVDTTSGKWAHASILDRVAQGEVDILLGTQMVAKGLDFPNITLVGVIDADTGINLPDFRASERTFQLLSQVAGRAGRGARGGEVLIQTRMPDHHSVQFALRHDYVGFARRELDERREPVYPPFISLANVIVSGDDEQKTAEACINAAEWVKRLFERARLRDVELVGPAPAPINKIKDRWRWHMLIKTSRASMLTKVARYIAERCPTAKDPNVRLVVDRDPVALL